MGERDEASGFGATRTGYCPNCGEEREIAVSVGWQPDVCTVLARTSRRSNRRLGVSSERVRRGTPLAVSPLAACHEVR